MLKEHPCTHNLFLSISKLKSPCRLRRGVSFPTRQQAGWDLNHHLMCLGLSIPVREVGIVTSVAKGGVEEGETGMQQRTLYTGPGVEYTR
jgi:hypothetical protein